MLTRRHLFSYSRHINETFSMDLMMNRCVWNFDGRKKSFSKDLHLFWTESSLKRHPVLLSTHGGSGKEADRHHKRIAELIADKRNESYPEVISHLRTRIRFSLLRSILTAVRGVRGRQRKADSISMVEFSLVEQGGEDF